MIRELETVTLKSAELMRVMCVTSPEPDWLDRLSGFLCHKGDYWLEPIRLAMTDGIAPTKMNFYVGLIGDEVAGNITTTACAGGQVGMLQHVFTPPEQRRKGIASVLMAAATDDFKSSGGCCMALGTSYNGPAYGIYRSFGFEGIGQSGLMVWRPEKGFDARWFAPGPVSGRETVIDDWAPLELLYLVEGSWTYRTAYFGQVGATGYEGLYWGWRNAILSGEITQNRIMTTAGGAVVGQAYLWQDPRFGRAMNSPYVLDFFVHPNFHDQLDMLIGGFDMGGVRKIQAYADAGSAEKLEALRRADFEVEATLGGQLPCGDGAMDVLVLARM